MHSNNSHPINDDVIDSNNSNKSELKSDFLDQLYKDQLANLRSLNVKITQPNDIEICRKWIKVFNNISNSEKMARNCLCALMLEQLQDDGSLKEPFTNLQNCNRNLDSILNEMDESLSSQLSNQSCLCGADEPLKSHGFKEVNEQQQHLNTLVQENQDILLKSQISELTRNLQSLRIQLTEKEIENFKLKEIGEKYCLESGSFERKLHIIKQSILENTREVLLKMQQRDTLDVPLKFFQYIFDYFSYDREFIDIIGKYDEDLQHVFQKQLKCDFDKRKTLIARHICRKFVKSNRKLREEFEHRLNIQNESYKLQLKMAKLYSFSILRQIIISFHSKFNELEGWQILEALEEKYLNIINGEMQ